MDGEGDPEKRVHGWGQWGKPTLFLALALFVSWVDRRDVSWGRAFGLIGEGRGVSFCKEVSLSCFFPALSRAELCVTLMAWKRVWIRERSGDIDVFFFLGWSRVCQRNVESAVLFAKAFPESCLCYNFSKSL